MPENGNFSANFDGDGISTKPLAKLERLTDNTNHSLKKTVIYCMYIRSRRLPGKESSGEHTE
jgi:hypothetical protein